MYIPATKFICIAYSYNDCIILHSVIISQLVRIRKYNVLTLAFQYRERLGQRTTLRLFLHRSFGVERCMLAGSTCVRPSVRPSVRKCTIMYRKQGRKFESNTLLGTQMKCAQDFVRRMYYTHCQDVKGCQAQAGLSNNGRSIQSICRR